jgi:hypothetical protein
MTCLFLGSGASKALAGIPTQEDFIELILQTIKDHRIELYTNVCGLNLAKWMGNAGDIELCMSHLHNLAYSGLAHDWNAMNDAKTDIVNLRTAIAVALSTFPRIGKRHNTANNTRDTRKAFGGFLQRRAARRLAILTTNYDLTVEAHLGNSQYDYPGIVVGGRLQEAETGGRKHRVPIYKLHGSINWLEKREWNKDKENLIGFLPMNVEPYLLPRTHGLLSHIKGKRQRKWHGFNKRSKPDGLGHRHDHIYTPILIPFFFQKDDWFTQRWASLFQGHWESAKRYLLKEKVRDYVFIGFGLPQADHYLLTWLTVILRAKPNARVTVLSPSRCNEPSLLAKLGLNGTDKHRHMECELNPCSIERLEKLLLKNGGR